MGYPHTETELSDVEIHACIEHHAARQKEFSNWYAMNGLDFDRELAVMHESHKVWYQGLYQAKNIG